MCKRMEWNGEIRICVDFRNLNQLLLKDNYSLLLIDQVLQIVTRSQMMSMLDGFSGYNQIEVLMKQINKKLRLQLDVVHLHVTRMPFGLINVEATFQRAMDLAFQGILERFIFVYLDDLTILSKDHENHIFYL